MLDTELKSKSYIELFEMPFTSPAGMLLAIVKIKGNAFHVTFNRSKNSTDTVIAFYKYILTEKETKRLPIQKKTPEYTRLKGHVWKTPSVCYYSISDHKLLSIIKKNIWAFECTNDPLLWRPLKYLLDYCNCDIWWKRLPKLDNIEKFMVMLNGKPFIDPLNKHVSRQLELMLYARDKLHRLG